MLTDYNEFSFFSSVFDIFPYYTCKSRTEKKKNKTVFLIRLTTIYFFIQFLASEKLKSFVKIINEGLRKSRVSEKAVIYIPA